jgi:adenylate cyclase
MAAQGTQRKLAAILSADVVGYSRLMGADEEATIETLTAYRKVFLSHIENHHGRVVDAKGDAVLAEFASVVAAVNSAMEIQRELAEKNAELSDDRRMDFRIGINLGDVVVKDDVIYGDGVNVAARLEALAEPGGICISHSVHDQVESKLKLECVYLGEQEVKNIAKPVRAYKVTPAADAAVHAEPSPETQTRGQSASFDRPENPSIAVLPFDNLSADSSQDFFADGLVEEILTSLSKFSSMTVIARNSTNAYKGKAVDVRQVAQELGVRYVMEGSVRQGGNRLRITAQLIDSNDGAHVWAERYDRVVEDIFDIQDEITKEIVTALHVKLSDSEQALSSGRGTSNVQAWGECVQALEHFYKLNPTGNARALEMAERAVSLDPDYALAWALLGMGYWYDARAGFTGDSDKAFSRAEEVEAKARALDETNPWVLALGGQVQLTHGNFDGAVATGERAVSLYPGSAHLRFWYGFTLLCGGQPEKAISMFKDAMRLNPHYPPYYSSLLARGLDVAGQTAQAMEVIEGGLKRNPNQFGLRLQRAGILAREGPMAAAKEAVADLQRIHPNFRVPHVQRFLVFRDRVYVDTLAEALRQAGLPE